MRRKQGTGSIGYRPRERRWEARVWRDNKRYTLYARTRPEVEIKLLKHLSQWEREYMFPIRRLALMALRQDLWQLLLRRIEHGTR